jgi:hypothetical protein
LFVSFFNFVFDLLFLSFNSAQFVSFVIVLQSLLTTTDELEDADELIASLEESNLNLDSRLESTGREDPDSAPRSTTRLPEQVALFWESLAGISLIDGCLREEVSEKPGSRNLELIFQLSAAKSVVLDFLLTTSLISGDPSPPPSFTVFFRFFPFSAF